MIFHRQSFKLMLAIGCVLSLLAAGEVSASPSPVIGEANDPSGDAPRKADFVHVTAEYDPKGKVQVTMALVDFAETARGDADVLVAAFFSKRQGGKCQADKFGTGLAFNPGSHKVRRIFVAQPNAHSEVGGAQVSVQDNVVSLTASAGILANRGYNCVLFVTVADSSEAPTLDGRTVRLRGR